MNDWLKFEKNGAVVTLTMNRPDIRNPLGEPEDVQNFEKASDKINNDRDIRCVILTGAGKAFSAGGNVKNMTIAKCRNAYSRLGKMIILSAKWFI